MLEHDPVKFAIDLSAKLASRSRHVCVFLGAGSSKACGLPDIKQLQEKVLGALSGEQKGAFAHLLNGRNLEEALSRLRRIAALADGNEPIQGLKSETAKTLDSSVCHAIVNALSAENANLEPICKFAAWVARADYHLPVELFTINYDLLLEMGLERLGVPYFDGFVGTLRAKFRTDLVEGAPGSDGEWVPAFFARLWKLHGSVNWECKENQEIVRLGRTVPDSLAAAIYPSDAKYEESRRVPFVVLQDRFRRALYQPETLLIISGYSFGDQHLNELIFDAASRCKRSEFVAFCHTDIPHALATRANITPNLQAASGQEAIIGSERGKWKPPEDPPAILWDNDQFGLRDFRSLATHLARSVVREQGDDKSLREFVGKGSANREMEKGARDNV